MQNPLNTNIWHYFSQNLPKEDEGPFLAVRGPSLVLRAGRAVNWIPVVSGKSPGITEAMVPCKLEMGTSRQGAPTRNFCNSRF